MSKQKSEYLDLTQHQIHALKKEYNLADAHTHQSQSKSQKKIVRQLPKLWYQSERKKQAEMEQKFTNAFWEFHQQPTAKKTPDLLVYAASIAMVIAGNYFKKKKLSVSLITPCFDNLYDILNHLEIKIKPLKEELLHNHDTVYDNLRKQVKTDVVFLVSPNNPTGWHLSSKKYRKNPKKCLKEIIRYCKDYNKILAIDFCFASVMVYEESTSMFDFYKLLEKSGIDYIAIEDTGKTWPLQDAKVAILKTSKELHEDIYNIHTAYLLNVSPFILNLVSEYIKDSIKDNCKSIRELLLVNRNYAKEKLEGTLLEFQEPDTEVSVAWFRITDKNIKATVLQQHILKQANVYVLPGTYFFWEKRERGEEYIRIALARNTTLFKTAINKLRKAITHYK